MLPLSLFASTQFTAANVITFVVYGGHRRGAVPAAHPAAAALRVYGPWRRASRCSRSPRSRWSLSTPVGRPGGADRPPAADQRRGPVLVGVGLALFTRITASGGLRHRGAACRAGLRLRTGRDRGPADVHRAGRGARGARGHRVGGQQRRGPGGRASSRWPCCPRRAGSPATPTGTRTCSQPRSTPRHSSRGALCIAGGVLAVFTIRNPARDAGAGQRGGRAGPLRSGHSQAAVSSAAAR